MKFIPEKKSQKKSLNVKKELESLCQILHLTHHRNRNQHHLSKWYKSFNQLRRHVCKLMKDVETLEITSSWISPATTTSYLNTITSREVVEKEGNKCMKIARQRLDERLIFMKDILIAQCFRSFNYLIADNQYAVLGLMLLGALARVKSIIQILFGGDSSPKEEDDNHDEREKEKDYLVDNFHEQPFKESLFCHEPDDSGEIISRQEFQKWNSVESNYESVMLTDKDTIEIPVSGKGSYKKKKHEKMDVAFQPSSSSTKSRKKKRKKSDVFDDIFDSLI